MSTADQTVEKQPSERRQVTMDFSAKMSALDTIEASSPAPVMTSERICGKVTDLTIETPVISGQTLVMWITGGTSGQRYRVEGLITTSTGAILEGDGILKVGDK